LEEICLGASEHDGVGEKEASFLWENEGVCPDVVSVEEGRGRRRGGGLLLVDYIGSWVCIGGGGSGGGRVVDGI
jgi:hypothetical protein